MNPEEKELLKKVLELSQENNEMLHSMKRQMFIGKIFRIGYWVIIIGIALGAYYYIQPYLDSAIGAYGSLKSDIKGFGDLLN